MKAGQPVVSSWSGGKDSCLALNRAIQAGAKPVALLTMLQEDGRHSRSHGLPLPVLQAQADALQVPLVTRATSWDDYERTFIHALKELESAGARGAVFGDIDIDDHRDWEVMVCREANLEPHLPLWGAPRADLLAEFWSAGFEATLVADDDEKLGPEFLGKILSPALVRDLERAGVDLCGEEGEYHTVVSGGPIFARPLSLRFGDRKLRSGYWFVEVGIL
jgi:uncharacterized protein (TIGR00290 family)